MSKVYDMVECKFLHAVMNRVGFNSKWSSLVQYCVTMVSYSILLNGEPQKCFKPTMGIP